MYEETIELLQVTSWKAKKLAAEVKVIGDNFQGRFAKIEQKVLVETEEKVIDEFSLKKKFIKLYRKTYAEIFKQEVLDAAFKSIEYTRKYKFFTQLAELINENIDFLLESIITGGINDARLTMEFIAGDFNDFIEGVEIARKILKAYNQYTRWGKMPNDERRIMVWREFIWPNDEYYDKTINTRFSAWGNKAPYWILLDQGNEEFAGAYPHFTATNFFYQAVQKIIIDLNERLAKYKSEYPTGNTYETRVKYDMQEVITAVSDLINNAVMEFIASPNIYNPGYIFKTYVDLMDGYEYKIYVTPGRRVGVRRL